MGILLGAIATGLGVGLFLFKANRDRQVLVNQLESITVEAQKSREENQQAIESANEKLITANIEVTKAQELIKALQKERDLLAEAEILEIPSTRVLWGWSDIVSLDQGISLKIPSGNSVESNDNQTLTIAKDNKFKTESYWLSIMPYSAGREEEALSSLMDLEQLSYVVGERLISGYQGKTKIDNETIYVLQVRYGGATTHLLWIKDVFPWKSRSTVIDIISTMQFETNNSDIALRY